MSKNKRSNNAKLKLLYKWRERLYGGGLNNEILNDNIRALQRLILDY
jgi:hypothetical protein